jgi:murein DD-endopeptidase MepM/ murein hydrolase activator NlpD
LSLRPKLLGIGSRTVALALAASALLPVAAANAAVEPGGLGAKGSLALADVTCLKQCVDTHKATPGATVKVRGVAMEQVSQVVFRGAAGPLPVAPAKRTEGAATAIVPDGALASRPYVVDAAGQRSERSPHKLFILPRTAIPAAAYPIRGAHQLWEGFGGARGHQGADLGAACGTPLVAALPGKIQFNEYHPRAGNYVVIDLAGSDDDIAYMHLIQPSPLKVGQAVGTGQPVGNVGETGNASGCHLHFEYWAGDWWGGGEPIDPVPILKQWEQEGAPASSRR